MSNHKLLGATITSIMIAADRLAIKFVTDKGDIVALADADCCSYTWIENIERPALGFPALVQEVRNLDMPALGYDAPSNYYGQGEVLAFYGLEIVTNKGSITIDYRNDSNGYYGGSLDFSDCHRWCLWSERQQAGLARVNITCYQGVVNMKNTIIGLLSGLVLVCCQASPAVAQESQSSEYREAIDPVIQLVLTEYKAGKDFVLEQAPDVVHQLLTWSLVYNLFLALGCLIYLILYLLLTRWCIKKRNLRKWLVRACSAELWEL